jgi:hypothetical protein
MFSFGFFSRFTRCSASALLVLFCLLTAVLFNGCKPEEDEHENTGFIPVGEWTSEWDNYIITGTSVEHTGFNSYKSTIAKAIDFSNDAGVIIIKITESDNFIVNKYTGVYYSEYTSTSIKLADVWFEGNPDEWYPLETDSLSQAESLFSVDNVGDHVGAWGSYTK